MIVNKIIEKTYLGDRAIDGKVIFRPPYAHEASFKKIETHYYSDYCDCLLEINCYNRDGRLASKWNRQTPYVDRPNRFSATLLLGNTNGQRKYEKYEAELCEEYDYSTVSHEYSFKYKDCLLVKIELDICIPSKAINEEGVLSLDSYYTEPLIIDREEDYYSPEVEIVKCIKIGSDGEEIKSNLTIRYKYDDWNNIIYREEADSDGVYRKTYRTIEYQENTYIQLKNEDTTPFGHPQTARKIRKLAARRHRNSFRRHINGWNKRRGCGLH